MNRHGEWLNDEDPTRLAVRLERVLRIVQTYAGSACRRCGTPVCWHESVLCIASGFESEPRCMGCMAAELDRPRDLLRDELAAFVLSKECLVHGWRLADIREESPPGRSPPCLWPEGAAAPSASLSVQETEQTTGGTVPTPSDSWDAGDLGCGELVLKLRKRMLALTPGDVFLLTATDPGAPEDIPAWCRLTGNPLIQADHPTYYIKRKE